MGDWAKEFEDKAKDFVNEGEKTRKNLVNTAKAKAGEAGDAINKGLSDHGIDTVKLGDALKEDAKNAGNFVVGGVKSAADAVNKVVTADEEKEE